jgi:imidazolonepropionase-like amidohydrolase
MVNNRHNVARARHWRVAFVVPLAMVAAMILVAAGLSPAEVLRMTGENAARALRSKDVGVIEASRRADLVLLGANPLEKIGNTRSIRWVTQAGNRVSDRPPTIL